MTLDEAKEILAALALTGEIYFQPKEIAALKLGKEGLARIQGYRRQHVLLQAVPLPGETTK